MIIKLDQYQKLIDLLSTTNCKECVIGNYIYSEFYDLMNDRAICELCEDLNLEKERGVPIVSYKGKEAEPP